MKISLMVESKILKHYCALILDYETIFPSFQLCELMISLQGDDSPFFNGWCLLAEDARLYFFRNFGHRALQAEASIWSFKKIRPKDVLWTHFFNSNGPISHYVNEVRKIPHIDRLFKRFGISVSNISSNESDSNSIVSNPVKQVPREHYSHRLDLSWLRFFEGDNQHE